jgi:hypothetical protein
MSAGPKKSIAIFIRKVQMTPLSSFALPGDKPKRARHLLLMRYMLLTHLATYGDSDGTSIRPSVETIASELQCSRATTYRLLGNLQELGRLKDHGADEYGIKTWSIVSHESPIRENSPSLTNPASSLTNPASSLTNPASSLTNPRFVDTTLRPYDPITKTKKINVKTISPSGSPETGWKAPVFGGSVFFTSSDGKEINIPHRDYVAPSLQVAQEMRRLPRRSSDEENSE